MEEPASRLDRTAQGSGLHLSGPAPHGPSIGALRHKRTASRFVFRLARPRNGACCPRRWYRRTEKTRRLRSDSRPNGTKWSLPAKQAGEHSRKAPEYLKKLGVLNSVLTSDINMLNGGGGGGIRTHGTLASTTVFEFDGRCAALYRPGLIDSVLSGQSRTYVLSRPIPSHFVLVSSFANRFAEKPQPLGRS